MKKESCFGMYICKAGSVLLCIKLLPKAPTDLPQNHMSHTVSLGGRVWSLEICIFNRLSSRFLYKLIHENQHMECHLFLFWV